MTNAEQEELARVVQAYSTWDECDLYDEAFRRGLCPEVGDSAVVLQQLLAEHDTGLQAAIILINL